VKVHRSRTFARNSVTIRMLKNPEFVHRNGCVEAVRAFRKANCLNYRALYAFCSMKRPISGVDWAISLAADATLLRRCRARKYRKFKRAFRTVWRVGGGRASAGLGADRTSASQISASWGRGALPSVVISRRFPAAGRARPCGLVAASCGLPGFAFGVVAGGVSRGHSGRCARCRSVVRFLQRAVLCEVGKAWMTPCGYGADGGGFFDAGHDPHRAAAVAAGAHVDVENALEALRPGH